MTWHFSASGAKQSVRLEATRFAKKNAEDKYQPLKLIKDEKDRKESKKKIAVEVACATRAMHYINSEIDATASEQLEVTASGDGVSISEITIKWAGR